jgi:hypothetical protein
MELGILLSFFGCVLILTAVVGGGYELRSVKMPKVGMVPRLSGIVVGVTLVVLGLGMALSGQASVPLVPVSPSPVDGGEVLVDRVDPQSVQFTISDDLGEGQTYERVNVSIDGVGNRNLVITDESPSDEITVTAPPGTYFYELSSHSEWGDEYCEGYASGRLTVVGGESYGLYIDDKCNPSLG